VTRYRTIVADPPWPYPEGYVGFHKTEGQWSRRVEKPLPYRQMTLEDIHALPVGKLADPAGAILFCWTTSRYLPDAFDVLNAWGFTYRQTLVWHKVDGPPFGGSVAPNHAEFLLVARRGDPRLIGRLKGSVVPIKHNKKINSRKPDAFLDLIEQVSPGPYVELFARRARFGWDYWGDQSLGTAEMEDVA
jgi:N6-adenosine-specific RNA methylase IME4